MNYRTKTKYIREYILDIYITDY